MKRIVVCMMCLLYVFSFSEVRAQENKLTIWSHWKQDPIKINFLNAVIKEFTEQHGIEVEVVWMEKNDLKEKLSFALDTPEPDITYVDGGFSHPRLSSSLLDLSNLQFSARIDPSWSFGSVGRGKHNFLPFEGASSGMYYNKQLFEKAGIVVPQNRSITAEEFLDMIKKLRAAGITPIGEGTADRAWKAGLPVIYTILRFGGPDKLAQLLQEEINFSDPDVVAALKFWKQVVDAQGYDKTKALKLGLNEGIYEVTDGKAAINFCGTWIYSKFGTTERDKGQLGVLDWFTVEDGKGNNFYELTWVAGYGINHNSHHIDEAKKFLEFLMTPTAASLWLQHVQGPYPVLLEDTPTDTLYGALAHLRMKKQSFNLVFHFLNFKSKPVNNMWVQETHQFVTGHRSVKEFIENINSRFMK